MANKKQNEHVYGSQYLPTGEKKYSIIRWGWAGINRSDDIDTGQLSDCDGITVDYPYIDTNTKLRHTIYNNANTPLGIFGFGDKLFYYYEIKSDMQASNNKIKIAVLRDDSSHALYETNLSSASDIGLVSPYNRSAVQFNVAQNYSNIANASYNKKVVLMPDKISMDFECFDSSGEALSSINVAKLTTYPNLKYATVYQSRLFGAEEYLVYASNYNNYAAFNLDTASGTSESNGWVSMTGTNPKSDGEFTGIWTYDNHVVLFKKNYMQLVYNNKNPFRIVDVGTYGCDNSYAISEMNGILYWVNTNSGVYAYNGGTPKIISADLDIATYRNAALGSFGNNLYLAVGKDLYTYRNGYWSKRTVDLRIRQFASTNSRLYVLYESGEVDILDWINKEDGIDENGALLTPDDYENEWWFDSDLMMKTSKFIFDVRRVKKLSVIADVDEGAYFNVYLMKAGEEYRDDTAKLIASSDGYGRIILRALTRGFSSYGHKIRFSGHGKVRIHACELKVAWGGDAYVEG